MSKMILLIALAAVALDIYAYSKQIRQYFKSSKQVNERKEGYRIRYTSAKQLQVTNQLKSCTGFTRLPEKAKPEVRAEVWELSQYATGLSIRFTTNSPIITVKWRLLDNNSYQHISPVASKGVDLYCYQSNTWQLIGVGVPEGSTKNEAVLIRDAKREQHEYLLNLPLWDGVSDLQIGTDETSVITAPVAQIINTAHPIIFYGTSITQGACASRPGVIYPSLLSRALNTAVINLGFGGNGRFEKAIAKCFMQDAPSMIILDCTANSSPDIIKQHVPELLAYIKSVNDTIPVLFLESTAAAFKNSPNTIPYVRQQNETLKQVVDEAGKRYKNLHYLTREQLLGDIDEGAADIAHLNDLGFYHVYEVVNRYIKDNNLHR